MRFRSRAILLSAFFLSVINCAGLPPSPPSVCEQFPGVPGPEDMALQGNRLLISSHDRRYWRGEGDIFAFDLKRESLIALSRTNEPTGLSFRPHGIDLDPTGRRLYVILHGATINDRWHAVAIYEVSDTTLRFEGLVEDSLLTSPNDLAVLPDGSFFVTIDSVTRGSMLNLLFGLKGGRVVHCERSGPCRIAADHIAYPNGISITGDTVYVTATRDDALLRFRMTPDHSLIEQNVVARIPGGDNLTKDGADLLTTSHTSRLAFLRHRWDAVVPSPSVVYRVSPDGRTDVLLSDDGHRISAASVAVRQGKALYLGQVFNPFLVRCRPPD